MSRGSSRAACFPFPHSQVSVLKEDILELEVQGSEEPLLTHQAMLLALQIQFLIEVAMGALPASSWHCWQEAQLRTESEYGRVAACLSPECLPWARR